MKILVPVAVVTGPFKLTDPRIQVEFTKTGRNTCKEGDVLYRKEDVDKCIEELELQHASDMVAIYETSGGV